jgi:SH3 domain protein
MIRIPLSLISLLLVSLSLQAADIRYVTDETEITMRTGPSTGNKIVRVLRSGDSVTLLETDPVTQYSLIETNSGKQGYVLSRFLKDAPIAQQQLEELTAAHQQQQQRVDEQGEKITQLSQELQQEQADNEVLITTLGASEQELSQIREAAQNTLSILEQNKRMQTVVDQLREEKVVLSDTNARLSDSTQMDWFLRGGAVSLIAFIIGIVVTRIRWRKKDSWGSY